MNLVFSTKPKTKNPSVWMESIHTPPATIPELVRMDQYKKDPLPKNLLVAPLTPSFQIGMFDRLQPEGSPGCGGCGQYAK